MLLLDDTAGERQADSPPAPLTGDAGLKQLMLHFRRDAGPSSRTLTRATVSLPSTSTSMRPPAAQCIHRVFHDHSSAHSIRTGSPVAVGPAPATSA